MSHTISDVNFTPPCWVIVTDLNFDLMNIPPRKLNKDFYRNYWQYLTGFISGVMIMLKIMAASYIVIKLFGSAKQ